MDNHHDMLPVFGVLLHSNKLGSAKISSRHALPSHATAIKPQPSIESCMSYWAYSKKQHMASSAWQPMDYPRRDRLWVHLCHPGAPVSAVPGHMRDVMTRGMEVVQSVLAETKRNDQSGERSFGARSRPSNRTGVLRTLRLHPINMRNLSCGDCMFL